MSAPFPLPGDQSAFEPETTQAMSAAFEDICRALDLDGDEQAREAIATRLIALARLGERDAGRLRDTVLRERTISQPRP